MLDDIRKKLERHAAPVVDESHLIRDQAAVLVPLRAGRRRGAPPEMLLTERAGALSSHGGEVAFPGGKADQTDTSLAFTALRENQEELGITPEAVHLLGALRPFVSKYGLLVTPFVGVVDQHAPISPNPDEIASVFSVPLTFFGETSPVRIDDVARHGESYTIKVYEYEGYEIWGLTALIVEEFLNVGLR